MGSWNHTCAISNLHITAGQEVTVFMLARNDDTYDIPWAFCPIPFYGKYNDYGAVEECHGYGMNLVVEAIRSQLYEFGQGANQYHDCAVRKDEFNIDLLFEADLEGRLYIEHYPSGYNKDTYARNELERKSAETPLTESQQFELDRLANILSRKVDPRRQVTHVVVHQKIVDEILNKWYIDEYVGSGLGTTGYDNSYNRVYFKDVIATVPEFIESSKRMWDRVNQTENKDLRAFMTVGIEYELGKEFGRKSPCYAGRYLSYSMDHSERGHNALITPKDTIRELFNANDFDGLEKFVREFLVGYWIDCFMKYTRNEWRATTGRGSQMNEPLGYTVLANAVLKVLQEEREKWGEEEDEDEDEPAVS